MILCVYYRFIMGPLWIGYITLVSRKVSSSAVGDREDSTSCILDGSRMHAFV